MNKFLRALCMTTFMACPLIAHAASAADQVQKILSPLRTLQANFQQTMYAGNRKVLRRASGKMYLRRPGKFRWETKSPVKQLIVADGQKIWIYDESLQQVTVQKQFVLSKTPAIILSGSSRALVSEYRVKLVDARGSGKRFLFEPKRPHHAFKRIIMDFSGNRITDMQLFDDFGQVTVLKFSNTRINQPINPKLFIFTPPRGVDVVGS